LGISLLTELQAKVVFHQFYGSDQFFSGHTGMPFLGALCFWHMQQWRYFYVAVTVFFGAVVLLGHYHYSIDVLAARFITHGIFQIACSDRTLRCSGRPNSPRPKSRSARSGRRSTRGSKPAGRGRCWCRRRHRSRSPSRSSCRPSATRRRLRREEQG
jgi:hypothetical protein